MSSNGIEMKRSYAVVWNDGRGVESGRLEPLADRFELRGRDTGRAVLFTDLVSAAIGRRVADRVRGLPVLLLRPRRGDPVRIASLEGAGVLHELAQHVERAGLRVAL
jgi:hypothetical protein